MLYRACASFGDEIGILNVFGTSPSAPAGRSSPRCLFVMLFGPGIIDLLRVKQG